MWFFLSALLSAEASRKGIVAQVSEMRSSSRAAMCSLRKESCAWALSYA